MLVADYSAFINSLSHLIIYKAVSAVVIIFVAIFLFLFFIKVAAS